MQCPTLSSSQPSALPPENSQPPLQFNELGTVQDAMESFTKLIRSGNSVCLHCIVPTWTYSSDTCLDLHDLHELRSRFLLFIHDLVESLRSAGITASYQLSPSDSSLCLVCAFPPQTSTSEVKATASNLLQQTKITKRKFVWLADLEHGPALIMT